MFKALLLWETYMNSMNHPNPSEEFELTANTLQAHGKLILKPLIYLTVHSRDDLTAVTFFESSVSLHLTPWTCCDLFVRSADELSMHCSGVIIVIQLLTSRWDMQVSPLWVGVSSHLHSDCIQILWFPVHSQRILSVPLQGMPGLKLLCHVYWIVVAPLQVGNSFSWILMTSIFHCWS